MQHRTRNAEIRVIDANFLRYVREPFDDDWSAPIPTIGFQFLDFEGGITDSVNPGFTEMVPEARPTPYIFYGGGANPDIKFSCAFIDEDSAGEAFKLVRILSSLMRPWRRAFTSEPYLLEMFPPPLCRLKITPADLSVMGFLSECSVTYMVPLVEATPSFQNQRGFFERELEALPFDTEGQMVPSNIQCAVGFTVAERPAIYDGPLFAFGRT